MKMQFPPSGCLSEGEAAVYLGISSSTLRHGRCDGARENRMPPRRSCALGVASYTSEPTSTLG